MAKRPITDPGKNTPPIKPIRSGKAKPAAGKKPVGKREVKEITDPGTPTIRPPSSSKIIRP